MVIFIYDNWKEIGLIATSVYTVLNIIARWTPTPKDDLIVSKIGKFLNSIFLSSRNK